jgi:hypothetical protein
MSSKRMFNTQIVDSDAFLSMPLSSQALYFHLGMSADDDGFLNNPVQIARAINASQDDMNLLLLKKFILRFDTGVMVIKHWKINNYIRSDRYKPTLYQDELRQLEVKQDGGYRFIGAIENEKTPINQEVLPVRYQKDTEIRLDKIKLDKISIDKGSNNNDLYFMDQLNKDVKKNTTFETLEKLIKNNFITPKRELTEVEARQLFDWVSEYPKAYLEHIISELCLISTDKRNFRYLKAVIIKAYDTWSDKPIETPTIKEVQPEVELDDVFAELKALKEKGKK